MYAGFFTEKTNDTTKSRETKNLEKSLVLKPGERERQKEKKKLNLQFYSIELSRLFPLGQVNCLPGIFT